MRFTELANKLTGISCPVFGISWNPVETQRSIARRIIIFLEARRVLFGDYGDEALYQCIESVTKIKEYLSSELPAIEDHTELNAYIRSMRKSCNKFLSCFPILSYIFSGGKCRYCKEGNPEYWYFVSTIGELRGVFGIMIGQIAKAYGLDVEDDLARIIPD
ncbi:MAG: prepilin peptidase [Lachnospiraceae bacterium]